MDAQLRMVVRRNPVIAELSASFAACAPESIVNGLTICALATAVARPCGTCPAVPVAKASDFSAGDMPMIMIIRMGKGTMLEQIIDRK